MWHASKIRQKIPVNLLLLVPFLLSMAGCATSPARKPVNHAPDFANLNPVPFNRQDVAAIALREWRLFGAPVADINPHTRPEPDLPALKPERLPGLWQRVGEYWWIGQDPAQPETRWTGRTDSRGLPFPVNQDGNYAWSAAFISYVMRIAGANNRFTYSPNHATYINAAASGQNPALAAQNPAFYAPQTGDILCVGRGRSRTITFSMLPTSDGFPAHCGIVVATRQNEAPFGQELSIIGGNVDDSVTLTHVPTDKTGRVSAANGQSYDSRYPWLVILAPHYDAEQEPANMQ